MLINIKVKDYNAQLNPMANIPLSFDRVLFPFKMSFQNIECEDLLIGHLLEILNEEKKPSDTITFFEIIELLSELGLDCADEFLNQSPETYYQMFQTSLFDLIG